MMGSFYTICFVAKAEDKLSFLNACNEIMKNMTCARKGFAFHYPEDTAGENWKQNTQIPFDFRDMLEVCLQTKTAYFEFHYMENRILVETEIFEQDSIGLHISVPEKESHLAEIERQIVSFILEYMNPVFCYAFCDSEAYIEQTVQDTLACPTYSVTVINGTPPEIRCNNWRVNGYTKREKLSQ